MVFALHTCVYRCMYAQEQFAHSLEIALKTPKTVTRLYLKEDEPVAIVQQISQLINLKGVYFSGGNIKVFPKEIANLPKLEVIFIDHTQIENLPKEIGKITSLIQLQLTNTKIKSLPVEIGNLKNLKYLRITQGALTSIPKEIGNLTQLEDLYLFFNQLKTLPNELNQLKKLERMLLHENPYEAIPTPLYAFLEKYGYGDAGNIRELRKSDEKMKKYAIWIFVIVLFSFFLVMFVLRKRNFNQQ